MVDIRRLQHPRYTPQIGEVAMPQARLSAGSPNLNIAGSQAMAGALGQVSGALGELANVAVRKQEEFDMLKVEEANSRLSQALYDLLHNIDTGLLNRRGSEAIGDNSIANAFALTSKEMVQEVISDMGLNDRQSEMFDRISINTAMPMWRQALNHENNQFQTYRDQTHQASMLTQQQNVNSDPLSTDTFNHAAGTIAASIEARYQHIPQEARDHMIASAISDLERDRIMMISIDEPILAYIMARESQNMTPEQQADLVSRLKGEADNAKFQQHGIDIFNRHGDNVEAAIEEINRRWLGRERDVATQRYLEQLNRQDSIVSRERQELSRAQQEFFEEQMTNAHVNHLLIDANDADRWLREGRINFSQRQQINNMNNRQFNINQVSNHLRDRVFGEEAWNAMSIDERDLSIQRHIHGDNNNEDLLASIGEGLISGTLSIADVRNVWSDGRSITTEQLRQFENFNRTMRDVDRRIMQLHFSTLSENLDYIFQGEMDRGQRGEVLTIARNELNRLIIQASAYDMFPDNINERNAMIHDFRTQALALALEQLDESTWQQGGFMGLWQSLVGTRRPNERAMALERVMTQEPTDLEGALASLLPTASGEAPALPPTAPSRQPSVRTDLFGDHVGSDRFEFASRGQLTSNTPKAFLGNMRGVVMTSAFQTENRPDHNGVDFSGVPQGTMVQVPYLGLNNMTVARVYRNPQGSAGFGVAFRGYRDGKQIEVRALHLRDDPTWNVGDVLSVGDALGTGGRTGRVRGTGSGTVLHIDMRYVDDSRNRNDLFFDPVTYMSTLDFTPRGVIRLPDRVNPMDITAFGMPSTSPQTGQDMSVPPDISLAAAADADAPPLRDPNVVRAAFANPARGRQEVIPRSSTPTIVPRVDQMRTD